MKFEISIRAMMNIWIAFKSVTWDTHLPTNILPTPLPAAILMIICIVD